MPESREDEYRALRESVLLYDDADGFLKTPLGRRLWDEIEVEIQALTEELKVADATKPEVVQTLQDNIWLRERFKVFIHTKIQEGRAALEVIQSSDDAP